MYYVDLVDLSNETSSPNYAKVCWFFVIGFSLLDLKFMVLHVVLCCHGMGVFRCDSVLMLSMPFSDSHGVMGF